MIYHAALTGRAQAQFNDIVDDDTVYDAFMQRIQALLDAPWAGWAVYPEGEEPDFREATFGEHGLVDFRIDEDSQIMIIFNIIWSG